MTQRKIFWYPKNIELTHLYKFASQFLPSEIDKTSYFEIHKWSISQIESFWKSFIEYSKIPIEGNLEKVIEYGKHFINAKFFPHSKINFAECILKPYLNFNVNDKIVIYSYHETNTLKEITISELLHNVKKLQNFFLENGLQKGDRVAVYLPNIPETIYIMLACTSLGGIFSSCSPDFGKNAVLSRFSQIQPKFFFFSDGYFYKGKKISKIQESLEILEELESVQKTVLIPYIEENKPNHILIWNEIKTSTHELIFPKFDFQTPVYIMYSSGTTGLPKCMLQGAGVFINHHKEHLLHLDLKPNEKIFYFTTCGWMMWNWLVSTLGTGASIVLYEGNPFYPTSATLWELAEKLEVNVFGTSAGYLAALQKTGYNVKENHNLAKLRAILSTGSPLLPEQFDFVYEKISSEVQLASISGGTDLNGCFVIGSPLLPVRRGEIQAPALGMDVDVWDDKGISILEQEGELVCKNPFPSMPLYFWNDLDNSKYLNSYFEKFPNVWRHGDFAIHTENGGFIILGRSDATLNPGGVRIGTADIYKIVESILEIQDSLVVGQKWQGDERIILFVKLKDGFTFSDSLIEKIKLELKTKASPRHVPDIILNVNDIPYTRNMKKVELLVKNLLEKKPITNRDSLHNPEVIEYYQELLQQHLKT